MSPGGRTGGWALDNLSLSLASAHLDGAVTIDADQLAHGTLSFGATNLDDLSPLILTKLSGAAQAKWRPRAPWVSRRFRSPRRATG